jgi:hypothetical protein
MKISDLSDADKRLNVESDLLEVVSRYGGEKLVADNPMMPRLISDLTDKCFKLAREGFLPSSEEV